MIGLIAGVCSWLAEPCSDAQAIEPSVSTPNRLLVGAGVAGAFDGERNAMIALEVRGGMHYLGLHPWAGVAWSTDGGTFIGGGAFYTCGENHPWQATIGIGPGYYERNQGRDLGRHLEFLSFIELSYEAPHNQRFVLRLAHISNGSLGDRNPGTELFTLGYLIPFGRGQ